MKRIKVRPGKFVFVSDELAERAARAFQSASIPGKEVLRHAAAEPLGVTVLQVR
jgi:hypothetical protein